MSGGEWEQASLEGNERYGAADENLPNRKHVTDGTLFSVRNGARKKWDDAKFTEN